MRRRQYSESAPCPELKVKRMAKDGIQRKLTRIRPPCVQISYDLQVGDAIEREELPFALDQVNDGVIQREDPPSSLDSRRFVDVNSENFASVLESKRPLSASTKETRTKDSKLSDPASN